MNTDGTVKSSTRIADYVDNSIMGNMDRNIEAHVFFGGSISHLGDIDGDGKAELAVTASGYGNAPGTVYILSLNSDGTVNSFTQIINNQGVLAELQTKRFAFNISNIGDLDKDGITDIVVWSSDDLIIIFLNSDSTIKSYQLIPEPYTNISNSESISK